MQGYGRRKPLQDTENHGCEVFGTPTTEYRHVLAQKPFTCQLALEDVFNEMRTLPGKQREKRERKTGDWKGNKQLWTGESMYRDLGLEANCEQEDVTRAYRKLAVRLHPDKGGSEEEFRKVQRAYDTLKEPERRRRYDEEGRGADFLS